MSFAAKHPMIRDLLRDLGDVTPTTFEEARALSATIHDPRSSAVERERAIRELVNRNLPLVINIASKLHRKGEDLNDAIQDGTIGLRRAAEKYRGDKGYHFSTYAVHWIKQNLHRRRIQAGYGRPYVIPMHMFFRRSKINTLRRDLASQGERISFEEAARRLGYEKDLAFFPRMDAISFQEQPQAAFEATVGGDVDHMVYGMAAVPAPEPEIDLDRDDEIRTLVRTIRRLPCRRARQVVRWYFEIDKFPVKGARPTLKAIGDHLGVTRERVRQIISESLDKLRRYAGEA